MSEPVYHSVREFAAAYGLEYAEVNRLIGMGIIRPRRTHGNSVLTETDMMKYVRWNTERVKAKRKRPAYVYAGA